MKKILLIFSMMVLFFAETKASKFEELIESSIPVTQFTKGGHILPGPVNKLSDNFNIVSSQVDDQESACIITPVLMPTSESISIGGYYYAVSTTTGNIYYMGCWGEITPMPIPSGEYDFVFIFITIEPSLDKVILVHRNVEIIQDMEIELNIAEADQLIVYNPVLPSGDSITTDVYDYSTGEVIEYGNVLGSRAQLEIIHKKVGGLNTIMGNLYRVINDNGELERIDPCGKIRINTNDILALSYENMAIASDDKYLIHIVAEPLVSQTATNDIDNFIIVTSKYGNNNIDFSPKEGEYITNIAQRVMYSLYYDDDYKWVGTAGIGFDGGILKESSDTEATHVSLADNDYFHLLPVPYNCMAVINSTSFENFFWFEGGIIAPELKLENGKKLAFPMRPNLYEKINIPMLMNYDSLGTEYLWDSPMSFSMSDNSVVYGDNCPITMFLRQPNRMIFSYSFIGRYGETRTIDFLNSKISLKLNDVEVCNSYRDLESFFWSEQCSVNGVWDLYIDNSNLSVDGLPVTNSSHIHLIDKGVYSAPTLTMLQFRDQYDNVQDKFNTANDGILNFTCGDFENSPSYFNPYFEYFPLDNIIVEYAPYRSDDFSLFEVEENKDMFFMPGYGAFYSGSLSQVNKESETKWYDLKITLVGDNGNFQEQTISPAFKIENVDISNVKSVSNAMEMFDIYTTNGVCIKKSADNDILNKLPMGLYILKTQENVRKVIVK